jgi:hypothetical protein
MFLATFALDTLGQGSGAGRVTDFIVHLMPAMFLLVVVAVAWRLEWVGGLAFLSLAAAYAVWARGHVTWILAIGMPMAAVSAAYFWSWMRRRGALGS